MIWINATGCDVSRCLSEFDLLDRARFSENTFAIRASLLALFCFHLRLSSQLSDSSSLLLSFFDSCSVESCRALTSEVLSLAHTLPPAPPFASLRPPPPGPILVWPWFCGVFGRGSEGSGSVGSGPVGSGWLSLLAHDVRSTHREGPASVHVSLMWRAIVTDSPHPSLCCCGSHIGAAGRYVRTSR